MESGERVLERCPNAKWRIAGIVGSMAQWRGPRGSDHDFSAVSKPGWSCAKYVHPDSGRRRPAAGQRRTKRDCGVWIRGKRRSRKLLLHLQAGSLRGGKRLGECGYAVLLPTVGILLGRTVRHRLHYYNTRILATGPLL